MSRILTADSQKLSLSILRKVPFLIFWSDKPCRRTNSAHVAWSRSGTWAAWAEVTFYLPTTIFGSNFWCLVTAYLLYIRKLHVICQLANLVKFLENNILIVCKEKWRHDFAFNSTAHYRLLNFEFEAANINSKLILAKLLCNST